MCEKWHKAYLNQLDMLPMRQLEDIFTLSQFTDWPNAQGLNALKEKIAVSDIPDFVCQSSLPETDDYYEQIIFQQQIVPTRPNSWHDLFNGLIWLQFPKTKGVLNQLHVQDIQQYGLSPRTKRRNNLTHFDECGVILTYETGQTIGADLIQMLAEHEWQSAFVSHRQAWGKELNYFMFGHANLEMLLKPFIGLTGKWLAVEMEKGFSQLAYSQQVSEVDKKLQQLITEQDTFSQTKPLKPLPLLGLPHAWQANQEPEFYANTDYFRPLRRKLKLIVSS